MFGNFFILSYYFGKSKKTVNKKNKNFCWNVIFRIAFNYMIGKNDNTSIMHLPEGSHHKYKWITSND